MLRVAIDMDEVMCPMIRHLSKHYKNSYQRAPPTAYPKDYNYATHFGISPYESKRLVQSFYSSKECSSMKPIEYSLDAITALKRKYTLGIITGRQYYGRDATLQYVNQYFYDVFDFVICTNSYSLHGRELSKSAACKLTGSNVLIDDSVGNCEAVAEVGCKGLLFGDYPWNADDSQLDRLESWDKIGEYL